MHYIPESAKELLGGDDASADAGAPEEDARSSGALYLLTWFVGTLLVLDLALGWFTPEGWEAYRNLFGIRLALIAALAGGSRIVFHTVEGLLEGRVGADLALSIATLAAIILGEVETAALVVFIAMCGEALEAVTLDRARRALSSTFQLCPPTAIRLTGNQQQEVPTSQLQPGDLVLIRPGDRVPADGVIEQGTGTFDEQAVTGESLPVDRSIGSKVFAGTVNVSGVVEMRVLRAGDQTVVAQVRETVAAAAQRKSKAERIADRWAKWFLPAVLLAALLTLFGWRWSTGTWSEAWFPALAVLVVACPCPLVLATPAAVMAAMAWLARHGVVTKGAAALERLADVDTFAFDKTGTLTEGRLELAGIWTAPNWSPEHVLRIASMVERQSSHPIARLIITAAEQQGLAALPAARTEQQPGLGLEGWISHYALPESFLAARSADDELEVRVLVGSETFLTGERIAVDETAQQVIAAADAQGQTAILVAIDGELAGIITAADSLRSAAAPALRALRQGGIRHVAMLTGDRRACALAIASRLSDSLDETHAEMLPADKQRWIETRVAGGHPTAMVGDGINDAPALSAATVGLAVGGRGSDLAAQAGDLILMGDPWEPLPGLVELSRALVRNIQQSIYLFAFGVNGIGVLLSATGVLTPVAAAIFHEIASAAVMLNALRLLSFRPTPAPSDAARTGIDRAALLTVLGQFTPSRLGERVWQRRHALLRLGFASALIVWLAGNLLVVREGEQAVVSRFGRHVETLDAGWAWRWPWPLEIVQRHPVDRLHAVEIGFRRVENSGDEPAVRTIEWTSDHRDGDHEPVDQEMLVLTADEVPVELAAEVEYRVADLAKYIYTGGGRVDDVVRATGEATLRDLFAERTLAAVLTEARPEMERHCREQLRSHPSLAAIGVDIQRVSLLDVHPPRQVVPAYRTVADALEQQEQLRNQAEAYARRRLLSAVGERAAEEILASRSPTDDAAASVVDRVDWDRWLEGFLAGDETIAGEAAATLNEAQRQRTATSASAQGRQQRLAALRAAFAEHRQLSAEQMYLEALSERLTGRRLTIVDPRVVDRSHIWLRDRESATTLPGPAMLPQAFPDDEPQPAAPHDE